MKITNKMKPLHISLIVASLVAVGCSEKKETAIYTSSKSVSSVDNSQYFPPQITIQTLEEDEISKYQWHLINQGQHSGASQNGKIGEDINISDVWNTYKGNDIKIAIIDTGVELEHPDLFDNIDQTLSYNYGTDQNDPTPSRGQEDEGHGTACAGISSAVGYNQIGVRGVAPLSKIVGLDVFAGGGTTGNFALALHRSDDIDIYSNSWGETYINPNGFLSTEMEAIEAGIKTGRNGLGSVYLFAAGNKRKYNYNGNYFKEQNNRFVISVGSLNANGGVASYSNPGANILICGFGGEDGRYNPAIVTTDMRTFDHGFDFDYGQEFGQMDVAGNENGEYTHLMNGTSAATPMVAGAVALILEAGKNQNLTYRDVKYILATTARKNDKGSSSWSVNGAGYPISHDFGFGVVDVKSAVEKAKTFESLGPEEKSNEYSQDLGVTFKGERSFSIPVSGSSVSKIEFVDIWVEIDHTNAKDLDITIKSPAGTISKLTSKNSVLPDLFLKDWRFGSVMYLDEDSTGNWELNVSNSVNPDEDVKIDKWKIKFYGH